MPRRIHCESCPACTEIDHCVAPAGTTRRHVAFGVAGTPHRIEYYPGMELGFVFPLRAGIYNQAAERHSERPFSLFERTLRAGG